MATTHTHSPLYTEACFPDFVPLGNGVLREIALAACYQHAHDQYQDPADDDDYPLDLYGNDSYGDESYGDESYDELFDGKKETTAQGEDGVWHELPVLDEEGEPTDDTEFIFELVKAKSIDEITLEQAHRAALSSLEGQAIEDIDFEAIAELKQEITPVQAAEIDATIEKKHRAKAAFTGKDAGRVELHAAAGVSSAEAAARRAERERVAGLVKQAELLRKKQIADHDPRPVKVSPCAAVFRRGQWCNPCACSRGRSCTWAHSPAELRAANDSHICGYDGGKGLCAKGKCVHRHTVPLGPCGCGMRDLWVGTRRVFKGKGQPPEYVDATAAILCACPRRPETDAELKARCGRGLRAPVAEALAAGPWVRTRRRRPEPRKQQRRTPRKQRRTPGPRAPAQDSQDGWTRIPKRRGHR